MADRDDVVDEEGRPHVPPVVEPIEPAGLVEPQMRGVEVEAVARQGRDGPGPGEDPRHGAGLDEPPVPRGGARLAGRFPRLARHRGPEARGEPAIGGIVLRRAVLDPARLHRRHDGQRLLAREHAGAERRGDHADAVLPAAEERVRVGEIDPVDPGRARVAQPGDEAGEVEGGGALDRHDGCVASRAGRAGFCLPAPAARDQRRGCPPRHRLWPMRRPMHFRACLAGRGDAKSANPSGRRSVAQPG